MSRTVPSGAITALVTPFRGGKPDLPALRELVAWQIEQGIDGLLACGCTGEAATLSTSEHISVVEAVIDSANGRVPVYAGSGKNDTAATIELSLKTAALGVSGLLLITPYYNKPTAEGQFRHFTAVADSVDCDVILYNVPGRTGASIEPETVARLAEHPRITSIKDAAGSAERVTAIRCLCDIAILSGDDAIAMAQVALGAVGAISVVSNIAPREMSALMRLTASGDLIGAREIQNMLYPLIGAMFFETNPAPVKKALSLMGRIQDELRLPLVPLSQAFVPDLEIILAEAGLI